MPRRERKAHAGEQTLRRAARRLSPAGLGERDPGAHRFARVRGVRAEANAIGPRPGLPCVHCRPVADGGGARRLPQNLRPRLCRRRLRSAGRRGHQTAGRVHDPDLGLYRGGGVARPDRAGPRQGADGRALARQGEQDIRRRPRDPDGDLGSGDGFWRVPRLVRHCPLARQPRLRAVSRRLFSQRTPVCACDPGGARHCAARDGRVLGGGDGADAVHALELSRLRGRFRRPRPARHLDQRAGRDRLDRELSCEQGVDARPSLGFRGHAAAGLRPLRRRFGDAPRLSPPSPPAACCAPTASRFPPPAKDGS